MKKLFVALFALFLTLGLSVGEASAARLGGGKSFGMQRQSVSPRPSSPSQNVAPAPAPTNPASAPTPAPKRNWMGPLAGLAAGLGIGALLSHFGLGAGMANLVMIALLAMAAVFVFKWLFRRAGPTQPAQSMQYAGAGHAPSPSQTGVAPFGSVGSVAEPGVQNVPEGFDRDGFLRVAKLNFVRLQASNDAKNLEDIRDFVSPELYAEIKLQMDERGNVPQQTDVVTLNAELLDVSTDNNRHIASVHFSGSIREVVGGVAAPFEEIWHLAKPVDGSRGWIVAGIQQL